MKIFGYFIFALSGICAGFVGAMGNDQVAQTLFLIGIYVFIGFHLLEKL